MKPVLTRADWDNCSSRVRIGTEHLLTVLEQRSIEATFFVLGYIAEREPDIVREIAGCGHEIATHGFYHQNLIDLSPKDFSDDLERSIEVLEKLTGQRVQGYRAPDFSLTLQTKQWATDILAEHGLQYDASFFPYKVYGQNVSAQSCSKIPYRYQNGLVEMPVSCVRLAKLLLPATGGAYCRHAPLWLTRLLFYCAHREGCPVMFYTHPWEYDSGQPTMPLPIMQRIRHYRGISTMLSKLEALTEEFQFTSIRRYLSGLESPLAISNSPEVAVGGGEL